MNIYKIRCKITGEFYKGYQLYGPHWGKVGRAWIRKSDVISTLPHAKVKSTKSRRDIDHDPEIVVYEATEVGTL